jgi:hypothetical protein
MNRAIIFTRPKPFLDAIALLKADHRKVEELFDEFEAAKGAAKKQAQAHGLQMSRIPPRAPFPNGIARGRRCRLRSKFAADSLLDQRV